MSEGKLREGLKLYQEQVRSGERERTETTHNWIIRAKRNPNSLKMAIGAMCFHCLGGTETQLPDPGWKDFIRTCPSVVCPLHSHRPYTKNEDPSEEDEG